MPTLRNALTGGIRTKINGLFPNRSGFTGPTLVAPGYARKNNIVEDGSHVIMNFPGPTTITATAGGKEDIVTVYCYRVFVKREYFFPYPTSFYEHQQTWNNNILIQPPFSDWEEAKLDYATRYQGPDSDPPFKWFYTTELSSWFSYVDIDGLIGSYDTQMTIHTLPEINGKVQPMVLVFKGCDFHEDMIKYALGIDIVPDLSQDTQYKINGQPINMLYGSWNTYPNACYAVLTDYEPDIDIELQVTTPTYEVTRDGEIYSARAFSFDQVDILRVELNIDGMSEKKEDTEGAKIRINANYDEHNGDTKQLEDFRSEGIVAADFNLLSGQLDMTGAGITGKYELIYPQDKILVWKENANGTFSEVIPHTFYSVTLPVHYNLRIEAIDGSKITNDVRIYAYFVPDGSTYAAYDSAYLTSIKTQFMLTFDDGPFANKTMNVVNDLADFYVNGEKVKAAFFMVGEDGSGGWDPWFPKEGIDENPTVPLQVKNAGHYIGNHTQHHYAFYEATPEQTVIDEVTQCDLMIQNAIGTTPYLFKPPYWNDPLCVYSGAAALAKQIVWGRSGFGELGAGSSKWRGVAKSTESYLQEKWNTKEYPNKKDSPSIICYHEYHDSIWMHMKDIVKYLQDKGFVLESFSPDKCVPNKSYYPEP